LPDQGLHPLWATALIFTIASLAIAAWLRRYRVLGTPAPGSVAAAAAPTRVQLGDRHRRRRPRRPAVLSDAALTGCSRASCSTSG
jgi:hypothetical protein